MPVTAEDTAEIVNLRGLHARAAARFVRMAEGFCAQVTVCRDGMAVCGTSIMGLLMLGAARGAHVRIRAEGDDAQAAVAALAALVRGGFGEED